MGMAFSLAKDRDLSRSRFNRQSPGFNSPGFVYSVLRIVDAGMAFSLAKDRGLSRCGRKCPHTGRTPMAVQTKGMLDVKDTVLRRELASVVLATRTTKNFFSLNAVSV